MPGATFTLSNIVCVSASSGKSAVNSKIISGSNSGANNVVETHHDRFLT